MLDRNKIVAFHIAKHWGCNYCSHALPDSTRENLYHCSHPVYVELKEKGAKSISKQETSLNIQEEWCNDCTLCHLKLDCLSQQQEKYLCFVTEE